MTATSSQGASRFPPPSRLGASTGNALSPKKIKTIAPPPSTAAKAKDPIGHITALQIAELDPTGARTRLFSRENPDGARVGDILLVRQRNGDPFAGVCLSIRRRGVDTGILLRNRLIGTSVEMWFKLYSPNVEGVELVQKTAKRARRARLYYLRLPKHDMGSVQNIVQQYLRRKASLGLVAGRAEKAAAAAAASAVSKNR